MTSCRETEPQDNEYALSNELQAAFSMVLYDAATRLREIDSRSASSAISANDSLHPLDKPTIVGSTYKEHVEVLDASFGRYGDSSIAFSYTVGDRGNIRAEISYTDTDNPEQSFTATHSPEMNKRDANGKLISWKDNNDRYLTDSWVLGKVRDHSPLVRSDDIPIAQIDTLLLHDSNPLRFNEHATPEYIMRLLDSIVDTGKRTYDTQWGLPNEEYGYPAVAQSPDASQITIAGAGRDDLYSVNYTDVRSLYKTDAQAGPAILTYEITTDETGAATVFVATVIDHPHLGQQVVEHQMQEYAELLSSTSQSLADLIDAREQKRITDELL